MKHNKQLRKKHEPTKAKCIFHKKNAKCILQVDKKQLCVVEQQM